MGAMETAVDHEIAVIGAGFSGIGAAIKLREAGFSDFVVLDEADGVGGTWHWNTYPGVAVDIPSFSYQFSFEKRSDWSRVYAPGRELKAYADHCTDKYGVRDHFRLNTKVTGLSFDEDANTWRIETGGGESLTARFVIGATGVFSQPKLPDIPGVETFAGPAVHTARWDHAVSLAGKRVAVIGTGASAIQVIPAIAPEVEQLTVFQRTPIWCLPKLDAPLGRRARGVLRWMPGAMLAARWLSQAFVELTFVLVAHFAGTFPFLPKRGEADARKLLESVDDPDVREALTPEYRLGCKRPSFSNEYIRSFNRENVHLETAPIEAVTPDGIRTADGVEHPIDVLVLATGFKVFDKGNMPPFPVRGAGGVDLADWWDTNRFQSYEGVSVPGFPNWFTVLGPYGFNGQSYFGLIETQMRHIVRCLDRARSEGATRVEITPEANRRYFESVLGRRDNQVFFQGTCANSNSYYFDKHGDVPFRPSLTLEAAWRSARFDLDDYDFTRSAAPAAAVAAPAAASG
jgi:cation diffusion facilitator CzcD-associated flavoprotein CzcO